MNEISKKKKRLIWFWAGGMLGIVLIFFIVQLVYGYYLSLNYTPDLTEVYQNVHVLQDEVVFGFVYQGQGWSPLLWIILGALVLFSFMIYRKYKVLS